MLREQKMRIDLSKEFMKMRMAEEEKSVFGARE